MSGWAALGEILAGGVQRDAEDEYVGQLKKNYDAFGSLEDARNQRAIRMYREQLPDAVKAVGLPPEIAAVIGASQNPDLRRLGVYQDPYAGTAFARRAQAAGLIPLSDGSMPEPDDSVVNRMSGVLGNKPVRVTDIKDGMMFKPYSQEQKGTITPIGEATVGQRNSSASANKALAGQRDSATDLNKAKRAQVEDKTKNPEKYRAPSKGSNKPVARPKVGEVRNGYKFMGGDPNKKANWKKV